MVLELDFISCSIIYTHDTFHKWHTACNQFTKLRLCHYANQRSLCYIYSITKTVSWGYSQRKGQAMQTPSSAPTTPKEPPRSQPKVEPRLNHPERFVWQGKILPAFWTTASIFSMVVNLILIIVLLVLGQQLFVLKGLVSGLIDGLHGNFVAMDQAHIRAVIPVNETIQVNDTMPVVFELPLKQQTEVRLTRDTPVPGATVFLNGSPVRTDIILRQGTLLNIALDLIVPVNQTIPVSLKVPVSLNVIVDIPLNQTELHQPFVGLKDVVSPYKTMLDGLPNSWYETPFCGPLTGWFCAFFLGAK